MNLNPIGLVVIFSSMITLFLAIYTWRRRSGSSNAAMFWLLLATTDWSLFYGLEIISTKLALMRIFLAFQYLGITSIPVLWLIFAARYTRTDRWLTSKVKILLFIIPLFTVIMVATNRFHFHFYSTSNISFTQGYWYHDMTTGPFYWVHIFYSYLIVFSGFLLFVRMFNKVERKSRFNILFFIIGALIPYAVSIAYIAGVTPYGFLDLTPMGFILMGIVLTIGIYSVNLFNINPLALDVLFDNLSDAIFVIDKDDRIVGSNPSARKLIRMKYVFKSGGRKGASITDYPSVLAEDGTDRTEVMIRERVFFRTVNDIRDSKGEQLGKLLVLRDITENKKSEEALRESERQLRETNASKDKFFSIIAHDLRSPFNSILGFSSMVVEKVRQKDYNDIEEYSGIIQDSAQRAMNLLNNLMEWSFSQTGRMAFNPGHVDIGALIREVIELFDDAARRKSISISATIPEELYITADMQMISSVFRNLISNAIKFTEEEGSITISVEKQDQEYIISVTDNGVGIEKEGLEKLFHIEESAVTSGTHNEKGTGLGLFLCREFVENHGGKIWAVSEPGKGSVFSFTLPLDSK